MINDQVIEIRQLTKIFGPDPGRALAMLDAGHDKERILKETGHAVGVHDVSLAIDRGEVFVIMGLSGSGKSTLLRCINRLIEPTRGEVWIDGANVTAMDRPALRELRRRRLGMVFQRFALLPHRTVLENVALGLEIRGMPRDERRARAQEALALVGLGGWENYRPDHLSGGMQQRVGLARALATDPDVLLMDEPFSALDPLIRREMQEELLRLQRTVHKTILFVTHDLDEALHLGDRIAIMKDGRVVQVGTP
ncbi:MAG TPA: glycine betaine/L-proline ABC transporter ATP-binding protein, partial [Bacillota bacterium]